MAAGVYKGQPRHGGEVGHSASHEATCLWPGRSRAVWRLLLGHCCCVERWQAQFHVEKGTSHLLSATQSSLCMLPHPKWNQCLFNHNNCRREHQLRHCIAEAFCWGCCAPRACLLALMPTWLFWVQKIQDNLLLQLGKEDSWSGMGIFHGDDMLSSRVGSILLLQVLFWRAENSTQNYVP